MMIQEVVGPKLLDVAGRLVLFFPEAALPNPLRIGRDTVLMAHCDHKNILRIEDVTSLSTYLAVYQEDR